MGFCSGRLSACYEFQSPAPAAWQGDRTESSYWPRNFYVCLFGVFTTGVSMTLLVPPANLRRAPRFALAVGDLAVVGRGVQRHLLRRRHCLASLGQALRPLRTQADPLGLAIVVSMMGMAQDVHQLVLLRLVAGLVGGYSSGSIVLIATQTARERSGWALG
ncbi:hypothetical protein V1289_003202 [Bradyrhizobium sp. AZCC 2289]